MCDWLVEKGGSILDCTEPPTAGLVRAMPKDIDHDVLIRGHGKAGVKQTRGSLNKTSDIKAFRCAF